ncbi:hypothetical protein V0M98_34475 (plasmid) [Pseudomonas silesiensis]
MLKTVKPMGKRFITWYTASQNPTMVTCSGVIALILTYDWLAKHGVL